MPVGLCDLKLENVQNFMAGYVDDGRLPGYACLVSRRGAEALFLTCGDMDVERGKPHPDIYLHAARTMGVTDPARCAVVEDSPIGVTGAVAAGMRVFGFAELMPAHRLHASGAHQVFDRMQDLPGLIATHYP